MACSSVHVFFHVIRNWHACFTWKAGWPYQKTLALSCKRRFHFSTLTKFLETKHFSFSTLSVIWILLFLRNMWTKLSNKNIILDLSNLDHYWCLSSTIHSMQRVTGSKFKRSFFVARRNYSKRETIQWTCQGSEIITVQGFLKYFEVLFQEFNFSREMKHFLKLLTSSKTIISQNSWWNFGRSQEIQNNTRSNKKSHFPWEKYFFQILTKIWNLSITKFWSRKFSESLR